MSKTYSAGIVTAYGAAKRAGYQGTYEDFCRQQAGYAESAATVEQAKNTAVSAASTATAKAGEATTAATAAQTAKTQTEVAASQALTDIAAARSGAISAVQTEGQTQTANARAQAQAATQSATTASTKASEASVSATTATTKATEAAASATSAANAASAAQGVLNSIPEDYSDLSEDVDQLKADLNNIDERNFADSAPIVGSLKNELLSYVNGGIPEQYIGANIAYTDEKYYIVSEFSNVTVPSGLRVVLAFYSDTDPTYFVTGLEKTADFSLSEFRYKYFRYCIRKVGSGTITNAEAKAVTLLMFNRYYADAVKAQGTAESYNSFLTAGVGFLANTLKVGRITSTGIIEGSRAGRYFDAYIPTKSIHSIEVPDGYAVNIYYYNANKVYAAASTSFVDFAPNTSYMYCRVNLVKYNSAHDQMLEFNDDVSAFADFKVNIVKGNMAELGDLLPNLASASTNNGITYTFENGKYYIKGTASAFSYAFLFNNENALPYGIVPGKRYFFEFEGLPSRINATIYHATSGGWVNAEAQRLIPTYYYGGYFDVPSDAVGLRISLSVNSGFTVDHVTKAHIYSVDSLAYAERVKQKATSPMLSIVYDDGLTKFKDYILPIIEAKKVPIATSIIVSAVEADNPNVMTYADIKECYEKGAEVLVHSKERTEEEWGTSVSAVAYELRTAKHLLNSKVAHVPNCYIYSAQSASYPVCRYAVQSEFMSAFNSGSQGSVSANNGATNYRGAIDPYNIKRRWADANWLSGETDAETILKGWIDELVANGNGWQVWTRHNYAADLEPIYATTLSNVIDYALSKGVRIVTVERGLKEYIY